MYKWARQRAGYPMAVGEATPDYMFDPRVPARVAEVIPEVRLLVLLRNPIDRAYSHYWHQVRKGFEQLPFEAALDREITRAGQYGEEPLGSFERHHHSYLARGLYAEQLQMWMNVFPRERFCIETSESLFQDSDRVVAKLFCFLGLPELPLVGFPVLNANSSGKIDPTTRKRLADYFRPHNQRLYSLLDRDLGWDT
jgi:hypothetical protein